MKDVNKLCLGCMRDKSENGPCPHCGFDANAYEAPLHHLKPGTILNGKYWVGKAIGEGGFGITYIGWDLNLEIKVDRWSFLWYYAFDKNDQCSFIEKIYQNIK